MKFACQGLILHRSFKPKAGRVVYICNMDFQLDNFLKWSNKKLGEDSQIISLNATRGQSRVTQVPVLSQLNWDRNPGIPPPYTVLEASSLHYTCKYVTKPSFFLSQSQTLLINQNFWIWPNQLCPSCSQHVNVTGRQLQGAQPNVLMCKLFSLVMKEWHAWRKPTSPLH